MNAILFNDTSTTNNPGCKGTVECLVELVTRSGFNIRSRYPLGYEYYAFSPCRRPTPTNRIRRRLKLPYDEPALDPRIWEECVDGITRRLSIVLDDTDAVIVNGEGTIHHDAVGALTLVGICKVAKALGKKVILLNCSIYSLHDYLLREIAASTDHLLIREPVSSRYLAERGVAHTESADSLFSLHERFPFERRASDGRYVIYTLGVLAALNRFTQEQVRDDIAFLRGKGYRVYFHVVEFEDERYLGSARDAGAEVIRLNSMTWRELLGFIHNAELVVSGRYHINLYAALASTPFIPMETNTPKTLGLLHLLGATEGDTLDDVVWKRNLDDAVGVPSSRLGGVRSLLESSFSAIQG